MPVTGVQYRGLPNVLQAVENMKLSRWAIFYGKLLNYKYEEENWTESIACLKSYLEILKKSGTTAIYTFCAYEDIPKNRKNDEQAKKIKPSTECDYSFNFTLFSEEFPSEYQQSKQGSLAMIIDKLDQLQEKNKELEIKLATRINEDDEEEVETHWTDRIAGWMDEPKVKDRILNLIDRILDPIFPVTNNDNQKNMKEAAAIGNTRSEVPVSLDQIQIDKIQEAITILATVDEKLGDNLMKLATIAKNNPGKYKSLVPMLNTFL